MDEEKLKTKWFELGTIVAREAMVSSLAKKSGEFFELGKDGEANLCRKLSEELKGWVEIEREAYNLKYHRTGGSARIDLIEHAKRKR